MTNRYGNRGPVPIICDECHKHDVVPFRPTPGWPILCRDCYKKKKEREEKKKETESNKGVLLRRIRGSDTAENIVEACEELLKIEPNNWEAKTKKTELLPRIAQECLRQGRKAEVVNDLDLAASKYSHAIQDDPTLGDEIRPALKRVNAKIRNRDKEENERKAKEFEELKERIRQERQLWRDG